ncbi:MAG: glycosyltransferase [Oscillatoriophycideae cyanobacterium NC_groundwater_1537_Pr4_S-0.65um_50_18]|nr:glycosyltransferase [Oscillatoriophycideae cyanobacterium NC_groundwater_1537_Pr4_S-0.65um_50_18]
MQSDCLPAVATVSQCPIAARLAVPLVAKQPLEQCSTCVIIPVRNEAKTIGATLDALRTQIDLQGYPLDFATYEVIVLANNCTDDSAAIARQYATRYPEFILHVVEKALPPSQAYIGYVRQLLMDEAYSRLIGLGQNRGVIASTDGDTRVAPTWIAETLKEIHQGADAVSGRLLTDRCDRASLDTYTRTCYLRAVGYGYLGVELEAYIDPDTFDQLPRHHQHGGASLAVTAEMYAIAGGMPAVRTPEDVAFYQALVRVGARFRHSLRVQVFTSIRQQGRTDNGMANQLHQWSLGRQPQLVESAAALETRLQGRRHLRKLWNAMLRGYQPQEQEINAIAKLLHISPQWLSHRLAQYDSFAELFGLIEQRQGQEGHWQKAWKPVDIRQAIADLRIRVNRLRSKDLLGNSGLS